MSICRQNYSASSEDAINEQKFFKKASDEEREHAEKLIEYQNKRGGRVTYKDIKAGPEWRSPLQALETALQMELSVNECLLKVHKVAEENNDPQMTDFIEGYLEEQVNGQKELADLITNLKRVGGDGVGLFLFDQQLQSRE